eukprot:CAMPEP_0197244086 /NCGR_PEP_ID=MMETSP1429-20130617/9320_1 /TAXON_ID=49237 /ORGANISM="Chaetoceros  sp., Strain UNC1202" /LENGTH=277 /DNA_ID=CAMNT_0042704391 /DNA_START=100 /DNA_END=933 /DNA_ORIENTATION=-
MIEAGESIVDIVSSAENALGNLILADIFEGCTGNTANQKDATVERALKNWHGDAIASVKLRGIKRMLSGEIVGMSASPSDLVTGKKCDFPSESGVICDIVEGRMTFYFSDSSSGGEDASKEADGISTKIVFLQQEEEQPDIKGPIKDAMNGGGLNSVSKAVISITFIDEDEENPDNDKENPYYNDDNNGVDDDVLSILPWTLIVIAAFASMVIVGGVLRWRNRHTDDDAPELQMYPDDFSNDDKYDLSDISVQSRTASADDEEYEEEYDEELFVYWS